MKFQWPRIVDIAGLTEHDESETRAGNDVSKQFVSRLPRAYYSASIGAFIEESAESVLGKLTANSEGSVEPEQRDAWLRQNEILRSACAGIDGTLFLEFNIPRMGRRIDAVLLTHRMIFVIEFKVGETAHHSDDIEQVWDYALDLKNFHEGSHHAAILPVLVATEARLAEDELPESHRDLVRLPMRTNKDGLRAALLLGLVAPPEGTIDVQTWASTPYHPTPTIIEAARSLYAQHSVEAISRSDAGARNLRVTSRRIEELVDRARQEGRKVICLVTGVPGAGKTLVGLNVATKRRDAEAPTHAVFLSGNGPLVAVLREALTRDEVSRRRAAGERVTKKRCRCPMS